MKCSFFIATLFLLFFSFCTARSVYAYDPNAQYILGFHIDPLLSWFVTDNNHFKGAAPSVGLNAGLEFEYKFTKRYSFLMGAAIDLRGAGLTYKTPHYHLATRYDGKIPVARDKTIETRLRSIALPLAINMRAIEIGYYTLYATAGLHFIVPFYESATYGSSKYRTSGMYTPLFINYMLRIGMEYSLGGSSAIQTGLLFDGSFFNSYRTGHGAVDMYTLALRVGFIF
ncbi:MAG: outer membrane beta-barrel protein [Bacteroides sp.]